MGNVVEKRLQVQIYNPVLSPTTLPAYPYRVKRRTAWPIPIRISMEHRLHFRFQVKAYNRLSDPICDSGHTEHPRTTIPLWYLHSAHRRREITPRRQPIPELIKIPLEVSLKLQH
jgi:hypothetical protein